MNKHLAIMKRKNFLFNQRNLQQNQAYGGGDERKEEDTIKGILQKRARH